MKIFAVLPVVAISIVAVSCTESDESNEILIDGGYEALDVVNKSSVDILKLRGFKSEVHYARTKDGYYIHVVRIINPEQNKYQGLKRPVIFNHGFLESSTIWLINSRNVTPNLFNQELCSTVEFDGNFANGSKFINGPMMLSNNGYDVWLMSMRGTDWSLRHDTKNRTAPEFWNYSLDDFALTDVPTVVDYVSKVTKSSKVGYIGHSQATFSVFGLLSWKPEYADLMEPVIAVAPVAYFDHITSIGRALFVGTLTTTNKDQNGPFPRTAKRMRSAYVEFCAKGIPASFNFACKVLELLVAGRGKDWRQGYFNHLPFYSSLKVVRHFGQLIENKRFMRYDYGKEENSRIYGQPEAPSYPIGNIRSKSLCLFWTKSDALSHPKDVEHFKQDLKVPLFKDIFIDKDFNHFDLITHEDARQLVFAPILKIFEHFEHKTGTCSGAK